jgi:hypothetical protein
LSAFKKLRSAEPVMPSYFLALFTINTGLLPVRFDEEFTGFLIWKLVKKIDQFHVLWRLNQRKAYFST